MFRLFARKSFLSPLIAFVTKEMLFYDRVCEHAL